ncbi:SUKH-3 domain-containing protein [Nannocystis pusilla]|uniref:SUKH-3 domain-containing protein n=1 Tax=Nannocystis pusilla TaxID=889268 RepID=UPI003DA59F5A
MTRRSGARARARLATRWRQSRRPGTGRRRSFDYRTREEHHRLLDDQCTCPACNGTLEEMGEVTEDAEEITVERRRFTVVKHKRRKYRCRCNGAVKTAPGPLRLIPDGRYKIDFDFAIALEIDKRLNHLPLDRQRRQRRRPGRLTTMAGRKWSKETEAALRAAGWREGRDIGEKITSWENLLQESDKFEMFTEARRALREFGELSVHQTGPGEECARSSFHLDPSLASGESDRFEEYERTLGEKLFPLGEVDNGHAYLAMGESGKTYLLMDFLIYLAPTFEEAMAALLEGKRGKMLM